MALIYGLTESSSAGWGSVQVIAALAVAVAGLASFPLIERRRRQPMFDLALLGKPTFIGGLVAANIAPPRTYGLRARLSFQ